jgi:hypothetical protein
MDPRVIKRKEKRYVETEVEEVKEKGKMTIIIKGSLASKLNTTDIAL